MCEIAVLDPEQAPIEAAHQIAGRFNDEQGDGLGVLAIHHEGGEFRYNSYKAVDPHWQTLYTFLSRHYPKAWRFVIHGRAQTTGKVNRKTSHPIKVDCPECDFSNVIHNGHVRGHADKFKDLGDQGHEFSTSVDTELIAHEISEVPDSVEDLTAATYDLRGNLSYLVFSEDGILVRTEQKYHLSDDFSMTCSINKFNDPEGLGFRRGITNEWMLITPSEGEPEIETKDRVVYKNSGSSGSSSSSSRTNSTAARRNRYRDEAFRADPNDPWNDRSQADAVDEQVEEVEVDRGETLTVEYADLCDQFEFVRAAKVAPGVIRVHDESDEEVTFVFRDEEPRLYYWYAPEPEPDNIDQLEQFAELTDEQREEAITGEQQSLDDDFDDDGDADRVAQAAAEEAMSTVAAQVEEVDSNDLKEIQDDVLEAARDGTEAAEKANSAS